MEQTKFLDKAINIISFDVPWPADYGGIIDVFYKLKELKKAGVKIILHCFEYGREKQKELEKHCDKVFYYKRKKNVFQLFSELPFVVKSRINGELKKNLLSNDYPILFEALHTCFLLGDDAFKGRKKIYRESNIEHDYYRHLASAEKNKLKKKYYLSEAKKLEKFEKVLLHADLMLIVSQTETEYFRKKFPKVKVEFLPSFHGNDEIISRPGNGKYLLYHGKLSVPENEAAAVYLIENVFSKTKRPVIIAGMDPSAELEKQCAAYANIQLEKNPSEKKMNELLLNAHAHCLYTAQPTGLKLKLLNVLYTGRFIIVNSHMLSGTSLKKTCIIADTPEQWLKEIEKCFEKKFSEKEIGERSEVLKAYDNSPKTKKFIELVWTGK